MIVPKIVNMTDSDLVMETSDGKKRVYPKSGCVAKLNFFQEDFGKIDEIPVITKIIEGTNLPREKEFVLLSVSKEVKEEAKRIGRLDCISPDIDNAKRDSNGNIVSVPAFIF